MFSGLDILKQREANTKGKKCNFQRPQNKTKGTTSQRDICTTDDYGSVIGDVGEYYGNGAGGATDPNELITLTAKHRRFSKSVGKWKKLQWSEQTRIPSCKLEPRTRNILKVTRINDGKMNFLREPLGVYI